MSEDIHRLAKEIAEAMNSARPGNIIDDSEEPVRDIPMRATPASSTE